MSITSVAYDEPRAEGAPFEAWMIAGAPAVALSAAVVATAEPSLATPLALCALAAFLPVRAIVACGGRMHDSRPRLTASIATVVAGLTFGIASTLSPAIAISIAVLFLFAFDFTQSRQLRLRFNPKPYGLGAMAFWAIPAVAVMARLRTPDQTLFGVAIPQLSLPEWLVWAGAAFAAMTLATWLVERGDELREQRMPSNASAADAAHLVMFTVGWGLAPTLEVAVLVGTIAFGVQGLMVMRKSLSDRYEGESDENALALSSFAPKGEGALFASVISVVSFSASLILMFAVGVPMYLAMVSAIAAAAIVVAATPVFIAR
jgi:hypothetical protein